MAFKDKLIKWLVPRQMGGISLPKSRVSNPDIKASFLYLDKQLRFIKPDFEYEYIPLIRKLFRINSSVSSAATTLMELSNPGFSIEFDKSVSEEKATELRKHLKTVTNNWGFGTAGLHGLVNKLILQAYLGGAISGEWVLKNDLTGIKYLAVVNPENIRVAWNGAKQNYEFWQQPANMFDPIKKGKDINYIKLNPFTYDYVALVNDQEAPIGIPPFLSAIDDLKTQIQMLKNIGFISDQIGMMGFLELLLAKPSAKDTETDTAYKKRATDLLAESKDNIKDGLKDGIVAGFKNDHEFNFHSPTKNTSGAAEIFDINHRMVSNGLFISPQFMGGDGGGSDTVVSVIFTKMLSQLGNIQKMVKFFIERGLLMELLLKGENVEEVTLKFSPTTITDDLKTQQAREIKQRVNRIGYSDGIYSLSQYARDMGEAAPDQKEPRNPIDPDKVTAAAEAAERDKAQDNTGDRGTRDKKKTQPKRKDQDSRARGNTKK